MRDDARDLANPSALRTQIALVAKLRQVEAVAKEQVDALRTAFERSIEAEVAQLTRCRMDREKAEHELRMMALETYDQTRRKQEVHDADLPL